MDDFVDDEEMILEVGQALLEKLGYRVIVAVGGKQAVEKLYSEGLVSGLWSLVSALSLPA